ncbi:Delta(24)-sterol reductase [Colletotrichum orbiculare MAFF 240422]|uniref:Delta(24)-sterol reductase n=1 Tax=Colletotrichum orbiculare (strain 104-T / ATCC 96160 / CBS 514.97 / LARS 414 / MAFF 240422) TaxID=1213857 RepID=N4VF36_COLOR|nr:Delta(24)-sterol reductase [Colletotrichum orbiculare MAFF 240422]
MERHKATVSKIATAVRSFFDRKEPYRIFHGSTNSTRPLRRDRFVDISALRNVLKVDKANRTALVEPNVPMDRLVESTLRHGLIPPVVMEFPGITAGGGYAGTAGESSSFKHGFFDDTINEVEVVLADGQVVRANRQDKADLFRGAAGAVGTLGVTTMLELQLIEAKKFVKTTYHRTHSVAEAVETARAETLNSDNDYVDGILFSKDHGVVITGKLVDGIPAESRPQTFSGAWDPWFYLHVKDRTAGAASSAIESLAPAVDWVPLAEYLFRYDRAGFWVGAAAFDYFKYVPFSRFTRWFLDDFLHTRMLYRALHGSGESARFIVQDLALPYENAERFVDYTADQFGIWPLWLCPLKQRAPPTFHPHRGDVVASNSSRTTTTEPEPEPMLNIGLWGWGPSDRKEFVAKNRALEHKLRELGGMKWLYAHTYYTEDEFWQVYDRKWYDELRAKYGATTLPTVFNKVKVDVDAREGAKSWRQTLKSIPPIGGLYGIWKAIQSKDYHLHRHAEWKYKGEK